MTKHLPTKMARGADVMSRPRVSVSGGPMGGATHGGLKGAAFLTASAYSRRERSLVGDAPTHRIAVSDVRYIATLEADAKAERLRLRLAAIGRVPGMKTGAFYVAPTK